MFKRKKEDWHVCAMIFSKDRQPSYIDFSFKVTRGKLAGSLLELREGVASQFLHIDENCTAENVTIISLTKL